MLIKLTILCAFTLLAGYLATWQIYKAKHKQFNGSAIQTKIHMWIPIFIIIMLMSLQLKWLTTLIISVVIGGIIWDFTNRHLSKARLITWAYIVAVIFGVLTLAILSFKDTTLFLAVWYMSVLADVTAYYFGTLIGFHNLPKQINNNKSWEGVVGQLVGAVIGWILLWFFVSRDDSFWVATVVGVGTALGDLLNSYVKRKNGFKDWSNNIPGHGGFLDRLSSLSFASILVCTVLLIKFI